jgi:molybdate transport system substrate-binding protein
MSKVLLSVVVLFSISGCDSKDSANKKEVEKKELLIYCGITMVKPMYEIAKVIEQKENCKINITQGGSRDLYESLKLSKQGDLYLPGSKSYIDNNAKYGLLKDSFFVGYNKAAIIVQKGNPKNISKDLNQFLDKSLSSVLCNPQSGSIGRETDKILSKAGISSKAFDNSIYLTTDSRKLSSAIKQKEADLVINWYATAIWEENAPYNDVIEIDEKYAKKKKLMLTKLSFSNYPKLTQKFIDYAISKEGRAIFHKYGFLTDDDLKDLQK